jgi:hypothetical protein
MCWKPFFAVFMLISTLVDYWAAMLMEDAKDQKHEAALDGGKPGGQLRLAVLFQVHELFCLQRRGGVG